MGGKYRRYPLYPLVLPWGHILSQKSFVTSKVFIGREAKQQYRDLTGQDLPDALVACVGGGF